ncbi:MAG: YSC84-related protein [Isosphaeraceae bacterium]
MISSLSPAAKAGPQGRGEATVSEAMQVIDEMSRKSERWVPPKILNQRRGSPSSPASSRRGSCSGPATAGGLGGPPGGRDLEQPRLHQQLRRQLRPPGGRPQATDLVLVFRGKRSVQNFLQGKGKLTMGVDASVAAGPLGRAAEAGRT